MSLQQSESVQYSKDEWLEDIATNSKRTKKSADCAIRMFELYLKHEKINQENLMKQWQIWSKKNDVRSICLSLNRFVHFLDKDQNDIMLNEKGVPFQFKKKNARTIRTYFSFLKTYLRICYAIKITNDDVKDYMKQAFPTIKKERRKAITIKILKLIFSKAEPKQKALYSVLISSAVRLGEALQLTKKDFHLDENPVRISLSADITKEKEARDSFISREAVDKLLPFIENKEDNDNIFAYYPEDIEESVVHECQYFGRLRERLGLTERYKESRNFVYTIHSYLFNLSL